MKVKSIVEDCQFHKGVVVSKEGFTEDAIAYAKFANIGLVILREPTEDDWEGRIKAISLQIDVLTPVMTKYEQIITEEFKELSYKKVKTDEYTYIYPDGTQKTIQDIIKEFYKILTDSKPTEEVEHIVKFPDNTIIQDVSGNKIACVAEVKISGKLLTYSQITQINAEDDVWLMMKSIFENKTFKISKNREISDIS